MRSEKELLALTERFITEDVLFGYISNIQLDEYFCADKVEALKARIAKGESLIVIGTGAACFIPENAPLVYADMARWEIQQRFRRHEVKALGIDNSQEGPSLQYKRGYFNDWIICDHHKDQLMQAAYNLIKNAIQAGAKHIDITAKMGKDDDVIIQVANDGEPIPVSAQEQIFIPFYTTKKEGSGIGLSISRQIMRQHNGSIELLRSDVNQTVFELRFR